VPYIYRRDDSLSRRISGSAIDESFNSDGSGIGDIELAARYQQRRQARVVIRAD